MTTVNTHVTHSLNEDALISLAATGDLDARHVLATRLKKLRWMGYDDAAKQLMSKAKARIADAGTPLAVERETD